ncbi:hypothetical protein B0T21DRAFT_453085 [Apiosordaria backusii]|uniref:Uncharacterized protein n=1 Tax=Apiosordaria backusii TaxID=314023 RepID=A0AA40B2G7_9PEZI|nr:hypothetical protein B0T21DRAFT_453085 [Apiosordaria backusii]
MSSNPLIPNNAKAAGLKDDNSYVSRPGQKNEPVPVISDDEARNAVNNNNNNNNNNSRQQKANTSSGDQLERNDKEAINKSNTIPDTKSKSKPNTRGAGPPKGAYKEPGDTEGLLGNDGRSSV